MTREVICVAAGTTLFEAQRLMENHHVRHLPVLEGTVLIGIISDRDVLRAERDGASGKLPENAAVGMFMTPAPTTVTSGASVARLAALMLDSRIDSIPVVAVNGDLLGLVTSTDLLELLTTDDAQTKTLPFRYELRHFSPSAQVA